MKILFGVQGTGNGHISRCRTLAKALHKNGAEVDYILSGRDSDHYFDMEEFGDYKALRGITFATLNGKINFRKTIQRIRAFRLIKDVRELDLSDYDTIISDFEPLSAWAASNQHRDCLGISNQAVCHYLKPKEYGWIANVIMKYYAPVTKSAGLHWFHFGQPLIPTIIDPLKCAAKEDNSIVVYLPFEELNEINNLLVPFGHTQFICYHPKIKNAYQTDNICYYPLSRNSFTQALSCCSGIITNTGFALISEALSLGKKILTKPVSGQFEQLYNASCLEQLNMATIMYNLEAEILKNWLNLPSLEPIIYPDVSNELAKWILDNQKETLVSLSHRLWQHTHFPEHVSRRIKDLGFKLN